ncbi:MAG: cation:proton antiporter [Fibrobacterota bacterium]
MSLNTLIFLFLFGGYLFGKAFSRLRLPAVLGMVVFGITAGVFFRETVPPVLWEVESPLKSFALTVILLRAGLGLRRQDLKKAGINAVLMSFLPALFECAALTAAAQVIFNFSFQQSLLTAALLSAVSPAVIVPSMLKLKEQEYGREKQIPTMILAGASVDDVIAITIFSLALGLLTGTAGTDPLQSVLSIPAAVGGALLLGAAAGAALTAFLKRHHSSIRATEKTLILLTAAFLLVSVGDTIHLASLLAVMATAFMVLERAPKIAAELSGKLGKIWIFAEIILFVLIGFSLDLSAARQSGLQGLLLIFIGLLFRCAGVFAATAFGTLTRKERLFCMIAYLPKATVQAALGSVALRRGIPGGEIILALAVLSIVVTAPLGLLGITWGSRHLLSAGAGEKE